MQAITTKYHGPTNTRGSRVSARAQAGRITLGWDHALNSDENHLAAATALANKYHWLSDEMTGEARYTLASGGAFNGDEVHVLLAVSR